jgi:hypothetical protein
LRREHEAARMSKRHRLGLRVALVLGLTSSACVTWASVHDDQQFVDVPADASCETLWEAAKTSGWSTWLETDEDQTAELFTIDETWILPSEAEWIVLGHWMRTGKEIPRSWSGRFWCSGMEEELQLEVRTCSVRGRRFGVVDPTPLASLVERGTPTRPCHLDLVYELRREHASQHHFVVLRRSVRPWLEGRE